LINILFILKLKNSSCYFSRHFVVQKNLLFVGVLKQTKTFSTSNSKRALLHFTLSHLNTVRSAQQHSAVKALLLFIQNINNNIIT